MATNATIYFGSTDGSTDSSYNLYDFKVTMSRGFNPQTRMIDSSINAGIITVTLSSSEVKLNNHSLQQWYVQNVLWSGKVVVQMSTASNLPETRTIRFEDARCLSIEERFNNTVGQLRVMELTIVAELVNVDGLDIAWSERQA